MKRLKPAQVDELIEQFAEAQTRQLAAREAAAECTKDVDALKARLLEVIELQGYDHTEKSKRVEGLHHKATATTGTLVQVDDEACDRFREYVDENLPSGVTGRFFSQRVTYSLVKGPMDVLRTLELPAKIRNRMEDLVRRCTNVVTKAPSLKVDLAEPEKV